MMYNRKPTNRQPTNGQPTNRQPTNRQPTNGQPTKKNPLTIHERAMRIHKTRTTITDNNIRELVLKYFDNKDSLPYDLQGKPLNDWVVTNVTDFSQLFKGRRDFNESLQNWNVENALNMNSMFEGCAMFNQSLNAWGEKVKMVKNMKFMFAYCIEFNQPLDKWNVSSVENMEYMLFRCIKFNQPLNEWGEKVNKVKNMEGMFMVCHTFNQPLDKWNVSSVESMKKMFVKCIKFNQPLDKWNVSSVENMEGMFMGCHTFNESLNEWGEKVKMVKNMEGMFSYCSEFNKPLNEWNVSSVESMKEIFDNCIKFNQPLNEWGEKVKMVKNMECMFADCSEFNQPLDKWNVSSVENMEGMFMFCHKFNESLNEWGEKVRIVKNMAGMFIDCHTFNQLLDNWNVSSVQDMTFMFDDCLQFNQPLNKWDVSSVESMSFMFAGCLQFNQPLNNWDMKNKHYVDMFRNCPIINTHLPQGFIKPEVVDPHQIHREFGNIDYAKLIFFFKEKIPKTENMKIDYMKINFSKLIEDSMSGMINDIKEVEGDISPIYDYQKKSHDEKNNSLEEYKKNIYSRLLMIIDSIKNNAINEYGPQFSDFVYYSLEYVKHQSTQFKTAYVDTFTKDCVTANRGNTMSCPKGIFERITSSLREGCEAIMTSSNHSDKLVEYRMLAHIIGEKIELTMFIQNSIQQWYQIHSEPSNKFADNVSVEVRRQNLIEYLKSQFPDTDEQIMDEVVKKYADSYGYANDVFEGGTRRKNKPKHFTVKRRRVVKKYRHTKKRRIRRLRNNSLFRR